MMVKFQGTWPRSGQCHADAVHSTGESPCELGLLFMRLVDIAASIGLGRICEYRLFQARIGKHLGIIDHHVPEETEIVGTLFEEVVFRACGKRIMAVLQ